MRRRRFILSAAFLLAGPLAGCRQTQDDPKGPAMNPKPTTTPAATAREIEWLPWGAKGAEALAAKL